MDAEVVNMARLNVDRESTLPPKRVIDALIDFSARRPETWPGLAPEFYEVYSVGETSAYVKEGSAMSGLKIWAREHYDWSKPGLCRGRFRRATSARPAVASWPRSSRDDGAAACMGSGSARGQISRPLARAHDEADKGKLIVQSVRSALDKLERTEA
jgi:hypothetical protein